MYILSYKYCRISPGGGKQLQRREHSTIVNSIVIETVITHRCDPESQGMWLGVCVRIYAVKSNDQGEGAMLWWHTGKFGCVLNLVVDKGSLSFKIIGDLFHKSLLPTCLTGIWPIKLFTHHLHVFTFIEAFVRENRPRSRWSLWLSSRDPVPSIYRISGAESGKVRIMEALGNSQWSRKVL